MADDRSTKARWQSIAETLAMVGIAVGILWQGLPTRSAPGSPSSARPLPGTSSPRVEPPLPGDPVSLDGAAIQGLKTAKVAVIEYSDYQCPFCAKFERETWPELQRQYVKSGKVLLAFRHLPLKIHPFARSAAEAATCAGQQGKFWEMHDRIFTQPQQLDEASLHRYGKAVGLDGASFTACLAGPGAADVSNDLLSAQSLKISSTPTFLVGLVQADGRVKVVKRLAGAQPLPKFQAALDDLIASDQAGARK